MIQNDPKDPYVMDRCFGFRLQKPNKQFKLTSDILHQLRSELPSVLVRATQTAKQYSEDVATARSIVKAGYADPAVRQDNFYHPRPRVWFRSKFGQDANVFMPPLCEHVGCFKFKKDCANARTHVV